MGDEVRVLRRPLLDPVAKRQGSIMAEEQVAVGTMSTWDRARLRSSSVGIQDDGARVVGQRLQPRPRSRGPLRSRHLLGEAQQGGQVG